MALSGQENGLRVRCRLSCPGSPFSCWDPGPDFLRVQGTPNTEGPQTHAQHGSQWPHGREAWPTDTWWGVGAGTLSSGFPVALEAWPVASCLRAEQACLDGPFVLSKPAQKSPVARKFTSGKPSLPHSAGA